MINLNDQDHFNIENKINLTIQIKNNNVNFYWNTINPYKTFLLFISEDTSDISALNTNFYNPGSRYTKVINSSQNIGFFEKNITNIKYNPNNKYYILGVDEFNDKDRYTLSNIVPDIKKDISDLINYTSKNNFEQYPVCLTDGSYKIVEGNLDDKVPIIEPNIEEQDYLDTLIEDLSKPDIKEYEIKY